MRKKQHAFNRGMILYGPAEVMEQAGITARQYDYWIKQGYLVASDKSPGKGGVRLMSGDEVKIAEHMRELVELGFGVQYAARHARSVAEKGKVQLRSGSLSVRMEAQ